MGTRASVKFFSDYDQEVPVVNVYHQFDGYISGVGHDLANWLKDKKICNGFSSETMAEGYANGMSCLAAQYVASQKTSIGGVYLFPVTDSDQSYNYKVYRADGVVKIKVDDIFDGTPEELLAFEE